jgi:hypothetical protein
MFVVGVKDKAKVRAKKPAALKGSKSETSLHWHVAHLLAKHLGAPAWFTTFPVGGGGEMRGKILKGLGLKSGVPDILIVNPVYATVYPANEPILVQRLYWIELKKTGKGTISDVQEKAQAALVGMGCCVANCDSLEAVKAALGEWQLPYQANTATQIEFQSELQKAFANV